MSIRNGKGKQFFLFINMILLLIKSKPAKKGKLSRRLGRGSITKETKVIQTDKRINSYVKIARLQLGASS